MSGRWAKSKRSAHPLLPRALSMGKYPRFNRGVGMRRDDKMDVQIGVSKEGYAGRLDVIASPTGRQESLAPDAVVSDVARRHGVTRWKVYDWRRRFRIGRTFPSEEIVSTPAFVRLAVDDGSQTSRTRDVSEIAIGDVVIRAGRDVDEDHLARIFRAVRAAT
jgi:transposase